MQGVTVLFHLEDGVWWAESPDVPGMTAAAAALVETRALVVEALDELLGRGRYYLREVGGAGARPACAPQPATQRPARPERSNAGAALAATA